MDYNDNAVNDDPHLREQIAKDSEALDEIEQEERWYSYLVSHGITEQMMLNNPDHSEQVWLLYQNYIREEVGEKEQQQSNSKQTYSQP
jgi:hypothetical protein